MGIAKRARAQSSPAFGPAETLTYDCKYLGLTIGSAKIMVGGATKVDNRTVWPIVGLLKTDPLFVLYPIRDKYVTWWDPKSQRTVGTDLTADEKGKRRRERVRFDRGENKATTITEKDGASREDRTSEILENSQDVLAAVFELRQKPLAAGDHVEIPVFTGRRTFTLKADVEGRERIESLGKQQDAVVLKVEVQFAGSLQSKRAVRVFVSDDDRHVPLRIDADFIVGSIVLELAQYEKGLES